jgi:predicted dehydrogenase
MSLELVDRRRFFSTAAAGVGTVAAVGSASAAPKTRIKIGQIGVAHGHATKLSVYRESQDYEVVGIVEPNQELRNRAEHHPAFKDLPWMTQDDLLGQSDLQVVLIETSPKDSLAVAGACVAAGKHIHLDKPAGESLVQFEKILSQADHQKLLVQMGYMYRYNPAIVLLRQFISQGWLGEIYEVHSVMSKVLDIGSRRGLVAYPGGMMFELGCHLLDLVVKLLGEPQHVASFRRHSADHSDTLQDNMLAVLEYPKAIASVKSSAMEVEGFERRHLVVVGTEGTMHIQPLDDPKVRLAFNRTRGQYKSGYQDISMPKYARYVDDAADMAQVVRGEKPSDFSYQHDLSVQRTVHKACQMPLDH